MTERPDATIASENLVLDAPPTPDVPVAARPSRLRRRILVVVAALTIVAIRRSGALDGLTDQRQLQDLVDDAGMWAPVLFTALFTLLVPVGVPGLVFVLPAAVVFSPPVAIAVSLAGGYGSSAIGMWFARTVGRDRVTAKLPPRFAAWNERIAERGLLAVIALRVVTYLAAPADWLLGITRISSRDLVLGTAIGLIPPTVMYVYAGGGIFDLLS